MRIWRLVPEPWAASAFTGEGARRFGGRWNSVGTPLVYLSSTLSLAALEVLVHADVEDLPSPYRAIALDVDDVATLVEEVDAHAVSTRWRDVHPPRALAAFGDAWVSGQRSPLARIASTVIPSEANFLFNPAHPEAGRMRPAHSERFHFDPRLYLE